MFVLLFICLCVLVDYVFVCLFVLRYKTSGTLPGTVSLLLTSHIHTSCVAQAAGQRGLRSRALLQGLSSVCAYFEHPGIFHFVCVLLVCLFVFVWLFVCLFACWAV